MIFLKGVRSCLRVRAHLFCGRRLYISKGPFRYLLDGKEDPIPLFDAVVCREPDPEDYLLDEPVPEPDPSYSDYLKSLESAEAERGRAPNPEFRNTDEE